MCIMIDMTNKSIVRLHIHKHSDAVLPNVNLIIQTGTVKVKL